MRQCASFTVAIVSIGIALFAASGCEAGGGSGGGSGGAAADGGSGAAAGVDPGEPHLLDGGPDGQLVVTTDSGVNVVARIDSGTYEDYSPSCEEQPCTADEQCVDGPRGTYCVHPCPGQPCPQPDLVPYCDRTGAVICQ